MTPNFQVLRRGTHLLKNFSKPRTFATAVKPATQIVVEPFEGEYQGLAVIGINSPERRNSLGAKLVSELLNVLEGIKYDQNIRVVIIRSLVKNIFCAGADLKERAAMTNLEVSVCVNTLRYLTNTIDNLPMPVIAAIDGVAFGGGLEVALACDLRVAATSAKMGLVETSLAIFPGAGGTQRLPRIVGLAKAKELIFTSRVLNGSSAFDIGLVNKVIDQNEEGDAAYNAALDLAKEILPNGPIGVKMAKSAINRGIEVDISTGCFIEGSCYSQIIPTKDRLEGLQAFKEKRKPKYIGE